ncbi:MAG: putative HNHc nuclease, partial [Clostridia bacterium]|nr:putative HNHc nuclease [Clostridia bacterium]
QKVSMYSCTSTRKGMVVMIIKGYISQCDDQCLTVIAPFDDPWKIAKQHITECEIRLDDGRRISADQRKKIYATIRDISLYTGHLPDEIKALAKYDFICKTGHDYFSLSDCDMTTANEFLTYLVDFCLEHDIQTQDNLLDRSPEVARYVYSCLVHKRCAVCGGKAEPHHAEDRIGAGRNRKEVTHFGMRAQPLCRKHHTECHTIGQLTFNDKYHIFGIKMDTDLCRIWKVKG